MEIERTHFGILAGFKVRVRVRVRGRGRLRARAKLWVSAEVRIAPWQESWINPVLLRRKSSVSRVRVRKM